MVCGIRCESTQRKFLSQDRDFTQALQIAIADEIADSESKALYSRPIDNARSMDKASVVNRVKGKETLPRPCSKPLPKFENKVQKVKCYRCGRLPRQEDCRYRNQRCVSGGKTGHISKMCRSKNQIQRHDNHTHLVKQYDIKQPSDSTRSTELYSIYEVTMQNTGSEPPIIEIEVEVGEKL